MFKSLVFWNSFVYATSDFVILTKLTNFRLLRIQQCTTLINRPINIRKNRKNHSRSFRGHQKKKFNKRFVSLSSNNFLFFSVHHPCDNVPGGPHCYHPSIFTFPGHTRPSPYFFGGYTRLWRSTSLYQTNLPILTTDSWYACSIVVLHLQLFPFGFFPLQSTSEQFIF